LSKTRIILLKIKKLRYDASKSEENAMSKIHGLLAIMALCIILVPVIAYLSGGWYAYWGHALLAIVFGVLAVFIKTRYYWEEE